MRKCGNCFRCIENWRDATEKGMSPIYYGTFGEYSQKPRAGVRTRCSKSDFYESKDPNSKACEYYSPRWRWNFNQWFRWRFIRGITDWFIQNARVPLGGLRKPIPLKWVDSFDGMADRIIPGGEPECPRCGEMPHSYEQCVFCGQRFLPDKSKESKMAPQRELREGEPIIFIDGICPECGYSCGNGGYGPLRCRCGWVGKEMSDKLKHAFEEGRY